MKVQRNAPCPCGSGKKYKKCCLQKETALDLSQPAVSEAQVMSEVMALDRLSNSVIDLIRAKRFDAAERVCQQLREKYPDQVDGIERLAMVYEAKGDTAGAVAQYREAAEFMRERPEGFDQEGIEYMLEKAQELEDAAKREA
jgi:Flp pilus assembly protein TadD